MSTASGFSIVMTPITVGGTNLRDFQVVIGIGEDSYSLGIAVFQHGRRVGEKERIPQLGFLGEFAPNDRVRLVDFDHSIRVGACGLGA